MNATIRCYGIGRLTGGRNLCYANAALQCMLSWRPFVDVLRVGDEVRVYTELTDDVKCGG